MSLTNQQHELTAAYVRQKLKGKALKDFESELTQNAALQEEVIFQKSILSALKLDRIEQAIHEAKTTHPVNDKTKHPKFKVIQNNIQQARIENLNRQRRIRRMWILGLSAAACIVLVSIFGLKTYLNNQLDSNMATIVALVESERKENIKEVSARLPVIKVKLQQAEQAFEEKKWDTTQSIFEQLRNQYKYNSAEMEICEGIIFYHKKEYAKSIEKLENINFDEIESTCQIQHFLTLSSLKIKEKSKAKEYYQTLANNPQKCDKRAVKKLKKYFIL